MRNEDLALFVLEHPGISPRDLSDRFGVGQRAMRNHIGACNAATEGFAKIEHRRQGTNGAGYYLDVLNKDAWGVWIGRRSLIRDGALPETAAERTHYILNDMLLRTDWITREHLAEVLFVSPASISASIKEAEGILAQFQLLVQLPAEHGGLLRVVQIKEDAELVTAVPERLRTGAYLLHKLGKYVQAPVAFQVAVGIVELLEVIQVDHGKHPRTGILHHFENIQPQPDFKKTVDVVERHQIEKLYDRRNAHQGPYQPLMQYLPAGRKICS